MAKIQIPFWDIAELFGLTYIGVGEETDKYGDVCYMHKFEFHDKHISRYEGCYDDEEEAKESVAHDLLMEIGKQVSSKIGDIS